MKKRNVEEGFQEDFGAPLSEEPKKEQQSTFRQYRIPIYGLVVLIFLTVGFVAYWKILNGEQNNQMAAYTPPVQQLLPPSQPIERPLPIPKSNAPVPTILEAPVATPQTYEYVEKMAQALEDIKLDIAGIKACEGNPSATTSQDNGNADLVAMIQEMTNDLKNLTESKKQLAQALQASERKIDELTQANSKLKANMDSSKKNNAITAQTAKKDIKSSPDNKAELKTWKVIGLSANRVVLTDKTGKIHNMGVGDMLGNIKIQSVDLESGNIKTTAGSLTYGE